MWVKVAGRAFQQSFYKGQTQPAPLLSFSSSLLFLTDVMAGGEAATLWSGANIEQAGQGGGAWILDDTVGPLFWLHVPLDPQCEIKYHLALTSMAQLVEHHPRKAKGGWFGSQSGHTPGLQSRSQLGVCERQHIDISLTHRCFSPCLSPLLPPLPKNK